MGVAAVGWLCGRLWKAVRRKSRCEEALEVRRTGVVRRRTGVVRRSRVVRRRTGVVRRRT